MTIKWLGHSAFLLTESTGITALTDPFDARMVGYGFSAPPVDIVTVSHGHGDHNFLRGVSGYKQVYSEPGTFEYKNRVRITGVSTFHDDCKGRARGRNTVFKLDMDGINIVHMGDIGEPCNPELVERLGRVNVLLVPVGGNYTVDAKRAKDYVDRLKPDIAIPMHYHIAGCTLDIDTIDPFVRMFDPDCVTDGVDSLDLDSGDFNGNEPTRLVILNRQTA